MSTLLLLQETDNSHQIVRFQGKSHSAMQFVVHIDGAKIRQLAYMHISCTTYKAVKIVILDGLHRTYAAT